MNELAKAISKIRYAQVGYEQDKWIRCFGEIDAMILDLKIGVLNKLQDELLDQFYALRCIVDKIEVEVI